jgi:ADP-dependent NAD(P)H-hydrate dehydratase / NAD(P)H-hydrate epimerase
MISLSGPILTAAEMRSAELTCGVPLDVLMNRAGADLAQATARFGNGASVLVLCGPGNNGGDGYVAARILRARGVSVRVAAIGPPSTDLSRMAEAAWNGPVEALASVDAAPVVVDALFGTGLTRALLPEIAVPLHRLAAKARFVIAADVPSGVGTDDGADLGAASANVTIALGAAKPAHVLQPGGALCGRVIVADIGLVPSSDLHILNAPILSQPKAADHKYTRGMVVVVGGTMAGAGALAAIAAARSGAGYVAGVNLTPVGMPHAVVHRDIKVLDDARVSAVVIGPGLGCDAAARDKLDRALKSGHPVVIDGDALALIDVDRLNLKVPTILTPHAGEFARLFGAGSGSKIERTRHAAQRSGATVIFKGADTVIASPDGRASVSSSASVWLSTAGTGDVLAGIAGAMLARGLPAHDAACAAVWMHTEAARKAGRGFIADDLLPLLAACL